MTVPENSHTLEGQEDARKTMEQFNSPAFQEKLRCQMERIQGENPQQEQTSATQGKGMRIPVASGHLFRCKVGHLFRSNLGQAFRCKVVH